MDLASLEKSWNSFGDTDPLWAVSTLAGKQNNKWNVAEFFATGEAEISTLLARLAPTVGPIQPGRALDFGCAVGRLSQPLATRFQQVDAVDISASMLEKARAFNQHGDRCQYHLNTVDNLSLFPDNTFDLVFSKSVLQHMHPRYAQRYIGEFLRVLKPSTGIAVFQHHSHVANLRQRLSAAFVEHAPDRLKAAYRRVKAGARLKAPGPVMEVYGMRLEKVLSLVKSLGGEVVEARIDLSASDTWTSFLYTVRKPSAR